MLIQFVFMASLLQSTRLMHMLVIWSSSKCSDLCIT